MLPHSFEKELLELLLQVRKPTRYLGNEIHSIKKDPANVTLRFALAYPDTYEIGMSNIGLSILYHILNKQPHIACERVYAPWTDMEALLKERDVPLLSLESKYPIRTFDILGFNLPYELTYTNILMMLDLAKIPFHAKDRDVSFPLIIGGGTGAFNPEPIADFFDAFLLGDGEEAILKICSVYEQWKKSGYSKEILLKTLSEIRGVYIPSFFEVSYHPDGRVEKITPLHAEYPGVRKESIRDLETADTPLTPLIPNTKIIHDRVGVEVQRGCTRGCRFCQAGYIYRPERQRSPETIRKIVREQIEKTGQSEVSLISLSIGDYDCIEPLMKDLNREHAGHRIGISIPATRVEQLTGPMMEEIRRVRKTGFTIAPEAATERMRKVINKGNTEEHLLETMKIVWQNGWQLIKFYFMIGLPTETDEDVRAIASLGLKSLHQAPRSLQKRLAINLGVSTFVPKPFTPFQWHSQLSLEQNREKLSLLRKELKARQLRLKPHHPESNYLEGIFSRGDRRLSSLIIRAWEKGCRFDEWEENRQFEKWKEAWLELGIDPFFYVERERSRDEIFPWDHLFIEMDKDWLWEEYQASLHEGFIEDCSVGKCTTCGVCDYREIRNRSYELPVYNDFGKPAKKATTTEIRFHDPTNHDRFQSSQDEKNSYHYVCSFSKKEHGIFLGHLDFVDLVRRSVARAKLPIRFSQGFHPQPRISFGQAMKVGHTYHDETFTLDLFENPEPGFVFQSLRNTLPDGIILNSVVFNGQKNTRAENTGIS